MQFGLQIFECGRVLRERFSVEILGLQVAGQLHAHEQPGGEEGDQDENESHGGQQQAVEVRLARRVRLVHDDESQSADGEQEAAGQALHDVLPIHTVGHKGHWTRVSVLIHRGSQTGRLHNHVVYDTCGPICISV